MANEVIGAEVEFSERADRSGMGGYGQIMDAEMIILEGIRCQPGMTAVGLGLFPFAWCMEGSGDPYFYRASDGAVVRVAHEAVLAGGLDPEGIDLVARSVDEFMAMGRQGGAP
jgi:hypothetical protein